MWGIIGSFISGFTSALKTITSSVTRAVSSFFGGSSRSSSSTKRSSSGSRGGKRSSSSTRRSGGSKTKGTSRTGTRSTSTTSSTGRSGGGSGGGRPTGSSRSSTSSARSRSYVSRSSTSGRSYSSWSSWVRSRARSTVESALSKYREAVKDIVEKGKTDVDVEKISEEVKKAYEEVSRAGAERIRKIDQRLERKLEEIKRLERKLSDWQRRLEFLRKSNPEMYNRLVEEYNENVRRYKSLVEEYNKEVEKRNRIAKEVESELEKFTKHVSLNLDEKSLEYTKRKAILESDAGVVEKFGILLSDTVSKQADAIKKASGYNPVVSVLAEASKKTAEGMVAMGTLLLTPVEDVSRLLAGKKPRTPAVFTKTIEGTIEFGKEFVGKTARAATLLPGDVLSSARTGAPLKHAELYGEVVSDILALGALGKVGEVGGRVAQKLVPKPPERVTRAVKEKGKAALDRLFPEITEIRITGVIEKEYTPKQFSILKPIERPAVTSAIERAKVGLESKVRGNLGTGEYLVLVHSAVKPGKVQATRSGISIELPRVESIVSVVDRKKGKVFEERTEALVLPPETGQPVVTKKGILTTEDIVKSKFRSIEEMMSFTRDFNRRLLEGGEGRAELFGERVTRYFGIREEKTGKLIAPELKDVLPLHELVEGRTEAGVLSVTGLFEVKKKVKRVPFFSETLKRAESLTDLLLSEKKKVARSKRETTEKVGVDLDEVTVSLKDVVKEVSLDKLKVTSAKPKTATTSLKAESTGSLLQEVRVLKGEKLTLQATSKGEKGVGVPVTRLFGKSVQESLRDIVKRGGEAGQTRFKPSLRLSPMFQTGLSLSPLLSVFGGLKTKEITTVSPVFEELNKIESVQLQKEKTRVGELQTTQLSTINILRPVTIEPVVTPLTPPLIPKTGLVSLRPKSRKGSEPELGKGVEKVAEEGKRKKGKYTPSIAAKFLDIISKRPVIDVTGFAIRPLLRKR